MTLQDLVKQAEVSEDGHARVTLLNGSVLIAGRKYRAGNSRGARRGSAYEMAFHYVAVGERYSKRVSKENAAELVKGA